MQSDNMHENPLKLYKSHDISESNHNYHNLFYVW